MAGGVGQVVVATVMVFSGVARSKLPLLMETAATPTQATLIELVWPKGKKDMKLRGGLIGKTGLRREGSERG